MKISDQVRAEAVSDYLRGDKTQAQVCTEIESRTGVRVSLRTLRAWISSAPPDLVLPDVVRARLVRALQHLPDLQTEVEDVLGILHERDHQGRRPSADQTRSRHADDSASVAAGPIRGSDLSPSAVDPAAASMPHRSEGDAANSIPPKREEFWE